MANVYTSSRLRRLYIQSQLNAAAFRTVVNTAGVWTSTTAKQMRYNDFMVEALNPVTEPDFKTGTSSPLIGIAGRRSAHWRWRGPVIPNAAATNPDLEPLLASIFGQAGAAGAYTLSDGIVPVSFFWYNETVSAVTPTNMYAFGCVPQTATFTFNQGIMFMEAEGMGVYGPDSVNFASYTGSDVAAAGGLTTFPADPGVLTVNGNVIAGFGGSAKFDTVTSLEFRGSPTIKVETGIEFVADALNDAYPIAVLRGLRRCTLTNVSFIDADSASTVLQSLKAKSFTKVGATVAIQVGSVAGQIGTFTLKNVQLNGMSWQENGAGLDVKFGDSSAHGTTAGLLTDDFALAFT